MMISPAQSISLVGAYNENYSNKKQKDLLSAFRYFSLGYVIPEKKSSRDMSYNLQNFAIEANVGDLAFRS